MLVRFISEIGLEYLFFKKLQEFKIAGKTALIEFEPLVVGCNNNQE